MSFNNVAIVYVKGSAYRIHFWYMSKDDAISIMSNSNLADKKRCFVIFLLMYKNEWENLKIIRETDVILNRAKDYYASDKERLREHTRNKYRKLT